MTVISMHNKIPKCRGGSNGGNVCDSNHFRTDRSNAIKGYKKLLLLLMLFLLIRGFRAMILDRIIVNGSSMNPNYADGDVLWVRKFDIVSLQRYQVVIAEVKGELMVKRVIGLPDESLAIVDGALFRDGEDLNDRYGYYETKPGGPNEIITLGEDEYYLMGDNRDESADSRTWGALSIDDIKGVVIFRFFPFWKMGFG